MRIRRLPFAIGLIALVATVLVVAGLIDVNTEYVAATFVGIVVLLGTLGAITRRFRGSDRITTNDPERRYAVPVPGDDLDRVLDQFRRSAIEYDGATTGVESGLRTAAFTVLTRLDGLTPAAATASLADGSWTDDPYAAATCSDDIDPPPMEHWRLLRWLPRNNEADKRIDHTARAIAAIGLENDGDEFSRSESTDLISTGDPGRQAPVPRTTAMRPAEPVVNASRPTDHWTGIGGVALLGLGLGVITQSPGIVLAGAVGAGYAGVARLLDAPEPALSIERSVAPERPDPDEDVTVRVTVTNDGTHPLADCRIVDGVPAGLAVTSGNARVATSLRPGESTTFSYEVTARRGRHEFDPAQVVALDPFRSRERSVFVPCETTIVCEPPVRPTQSPVPLREASATFAGRLPTSDGGEGIEFHSIREYRPGDPLNRIDWHRHARTRELATVEFRRERAARVVVLVDARKDAYLAPEPGATHAVDRSVEAAGRIAATLLEAGDTVGLAGIGPDETARVDREQDRRDGHHEPCWLAPASGPSHRARLGKLLARHPQFSTIPPRDKCLWWRQFRTIRRRLTAETQIVFCTPLCDSNAVEVARRLQARSHAVTVVSPDPTVTDTASGQLASVARRVRQYDLERTGVTVIDWPTGQTIDEVFARTRAGGGT